MIDYEKSYQDNLTDKYKEVNEEYNTYIKLYYSENAMCPIDIKTKLEKSRDKNLIYLSCKTKNNKKWEAKIKMPNIVNLYKVKTENVNLYKNYIKDLKDRLKKSMISPLYKPDEDNEAIELLEKSKKYQKIIDSINSILQNQEENLDILINEKKEKIKTLAELSLKRKNTFKQLKKVDRDIKEKLKEISINEKNPSHVRLNQISKNTGLSIKEINDWISWFVCMYDYTKLSVELQNLNNDLIEKTRLFRRINENFVLEPPLVDIKTDSKIVYEDKKESKRKVDKTKVKLKIKKKEKK